MKKSITLFFICLIAFCTAQNSNYIPFPSTLVSYGYNHIYGADYHYFSIFRAEINGDTLFNGIHYSKYYLAEKFPDNQYLQQYPNPSGPYNILVGGIRNDIQAKKVYLYSIKTKTEELLYDFDLHVGDTLFKDTGYGLPRSILDSWQPLKNRDTVWVSRIDSILMPHDGRYHRRFNLKARYGYTSTYYTITSDTVFVAPHKEYRIKINPLIEGVGFPYSPISLLMGFEAGYELALYCMTIDKKTWYHGNIPPPFMYDAYCYSIIDAVNENEKIELVSIYPNPGDGKFKLVAPDFHPSFIEVTNALGICIFKSTIENETTDFDLSTQAPGMYFIRIFNADNTCMSRKLIIR